MHLISWTLRSGSEHFLYGVNDSIPLMHDSYQDVMIHDVYLGAGP